MEKIIVYASSTCNASGTGCTYEAELSNAFAPIIAIAGIFIFIVGFKMGINLFFK